MKTAANKGFTLIEITIVIVIIGLLAAAILTSRSLFSAAESRTLIAEQNVFVTAFKEFSNKYMALPGDMDNATSYWYNDASCPNTTANTTPKVPTCDGNSDGRVGDWKNGTVTTQYEWYRAWQHLANSELIPGMYSGVGSPTSSDAIPGTNIPDSGIGRGGWMLLHMISDGSTDTAFFNSAVSSHVLIFGGASSSGISDAGIITPSLAKEIDTKIDDAMPFTGNIRAKKSSATTCTVSSATTSDYLTSSESQSCQLIFIMGL